MYHFFNFLLLSSFKHFLSVSTDNAKFPREMFSEEVQQLPKNAPPQTTPLIVALHSEDSTYTKLRDRNFGAVGNYLSKFAKDVSAAFQVCQLNLVTIFLCMVYGCYLFKMY